MVTVRYYMWPMIMALAALANVVVSTFAALSSLFSLVVVVVSPSLLTLSYSTHTVSFSYSFYT